MQRELFRSTALQTGALVWAVQELGVAAREQGRLGEYALSFGEDTDGELYLLTSESGGPTGQTGQVYRLSPGR